MKLWIWTLVMTVVAGCNEGGSGKSRGVSEPWLNLNKIGKYAKVSADANAEFPKGKAGPTPSTPCCSQPSKKCENTASDWASGVWAELEFSLSEPTAFQYSYESDGKSFKAEAVGDPACTGSLTRYGVSGTIVNSGAEIVGPTAL